MHRSLGGIGSCIHGFDVECILSCTQNMVLRRAGNRGVREMVRFVVGWVGPMLHQFW